MTFLGELHRPVFYRYRVARPGFRPVLNRYPGCLIGVALVVGHYAYCVKWGYASAPLPSWPECEVCGGEVRIVGQGVEARICTGCFISTRLATDGEGRK